MLQNFSKLCKSDEDDDGDGDGDGGACDEKSVMQKKI